MQDTEYCYPWLFAQPMLSTNKIYTSRHFQSNILSWNKD